MVVTYCAAGLKSLKIDSSHSTPPHHNYWNGASAQEGSPFLKGVNGSFCISRSLMIQKHCQFLELRKVKRFRLMFLNVGRIKL